MRLYLGTIPVDQQPLLHGEGWQLCSALDPTRVQNYGLLAGVAGVLLVDVLLRGAITPSSLWSALLIVVLTVPVHELIHALATPGWGLTDRTAIGLQRDKGLLLPYAYYDGIMPLWRFLFTGLAPLMLLTILPLILILSVPLDNLLRTSLAFLAIFNMAISGGDLVTLIWVSIRLPMRSLVWQHGWSLVWKKDEIR